MSGLRRAAVVIAQHKPYSFLSPSTAPRGNKRFAIDLLTASNMQHGSAWGAERRRDPRDLGGLACAGRLDADSTGLMLWTDDERLVERIIGPRTTVEKEYLVRVTGHEKWGEAQLRDAVEWLTEGIHLDGEPLRPAEFGWLNDMQMRVTLREGRHRQIRRMCDLVGLRVTAIKRVRIGNLRLENLKVGFWRALAPPAAGDILRASSAPNASPPRAPGQR